MSKTERNISKSPTDRDIFKKQLNDEAIRSYIIRETSEKVPEGSITHFTDIIKQDKVSEKIIKEIKAPEEIIKEVEAANTTKPNTYVLGKLINKNIEMFLKDPITYQENFINFYTDFNIISEIKKQNMTEVNTKRLIKAYYFLKYLMCKTHYNKAKEAVSKKYDIHIDTITKLCSLIGAYKKHGRIKK